MLKRLATLSHLSFMLLLSGCATYFERAAQNACFNKDWFATGFNAAKYGRASDEIWQREDRKCAKHNLWSNKNDFQRGYELGLDAFCTEQNGFEFGLRNRRYEPLCTTDVQWDFDLAYYDGQTIHHTRRSLSNTQHAIDRAHDVIKRTTKRRKHLICEIQSGKLDDETKKRYVHEHYNLKKQRESAQYDLYEYRDRVRKLTSKLNDIESSFQQHYYPNGYPQETSYSVEHSVVSENDVVKQTAILLYKPVVFDQRVFNKKHTKDLNEQIKTIVEHIRLNHQREFRFQLIRDADLSFLKSNGNEITLNTTEKFGTRSSLIFWHPEQNPVFQALKVGSTPPLIALDSFINQHDNSTAVQSASN